MARVIFLVDMNAFFISCETAEDRSLRGKPAAVAGDPKNRSGIILAANYDARKYGVRTTMLIHEARKLCPGLILIPPHHKLYNEKSRQVMEILARYTPVVQQNSIDEAWLDMTGCEELFGSPFKTAERIMDNIESELGLWCSIGISENKFLAKMASEIKKPMGITEVWEKDVPVKIWPLAVREMYGIGEQTEKKLGSLGIFTIGDIAQCSSKILVSALGKYGEELHRLANGKDSSPVTGHPRYESKTISRSTTLPRDIVDMELAKTVLLRLAEEVGAEARKYGCKGRTVSVVLKYEDFQSITRQKTIQPTYLTRDIYNTGTDLLKENWNGLRKIRLIGIGLGNFDENEAKQLSIFDIMEGTDGSKKEEKLEKAMDNIREKYGMDSVTRAKMINAAGKSGTGVFSI